VQPYLRPRGFPGLPIGLLFDHVVACSFDRQARLLSDGETVSPIEDCCHIRSDLRSQIPQHNPCPEAPPEAGVAPPPCRPPAARPLVARMPRPPAARAAAAAPLPPCPFWMAPAPLRGTPHKHGRPRYQVPDLSPLRRANPAGLPAYRLAQRRWELPGSRPGRAAAAPLSSGRARRLPAAHRRLTLSTGQHAGTVSRWLFLCELPACRRPPAACSAALSAARLTVPSSRPVAHPAPPPTPPHPPPRLTARPAPPPAP